MKPLYVLYKQVIDDDKRDLHWECQGCYVSKVSAMLACEDLVKTDLSWCETITKQGLDMWIGYDKDYKVMASIVERV